MKATAAIAPLSPPRIEGPRPTSTLRAVNAGQQTAIAPHPLPETAPPTDPGDHVLVFSDEDGQYRFSEFPGAEVELRIGCPGWALALCEHCGVLLRGPGGEEMDAEECYWLAEERERGFVVDGRDIPHWMYEESCGVGLGPYPPEMLTGRQLLYWFGSVRKHFLAKAGVFVDKEDIIRWLGYEVEDRALLAKFRAYLERRAPDDEE
jgi:hypothetical protein